MSMASSSYLDSLHEQFRVNPLSVDASWRYVFQFIDDFLHLGGEDNEPSGDGATALKAHLFRRYAHLVADINPLSTPTDDATSLWQRHLGHQLSLPDESTRLRSLYQNKLAIETAHISRFELMQWVDELVDQLGDQLPAGALLQAWQRLLEADEFERFMMKRFTGKKKFGAEGSEILLVALDQVLIQAAAMGVEEVVIGTMHRGRLNLMVNVLGKSLDDLFVEFMGQHPFPLALSTAADVPYHLGLSGTIERAGAQIRVTLLPNPSHLEAVDPVTLGWTRAAQDKCLNKERSKVMAVIIHTDAAVIGQGVVSETIQLAGVEGFSTAGTVHLVVNNQLGFTTEPEEGRTSRYCTDSWKATDSLILHVNGESPEAAIQAAELAVRYRQTHARDVVIDLIAYRRNGHNEFDEPRFTQPVLYEKLDGRTPLITSFGKQLIAAGALTQQEADQFATRYREKLEAAYGRAQTQLSHEECAKPAVSSVDPAAVFLPAAQLVTGVDDLQLHHLLNVLAHVPPTLTLGERLSRQIRARNKIDRGVPWAVSEALCFGSLLAEGMDVRLSGQDVVRGAFSHRHFTLVDTNTNEKYCSLNSVGSEQGRFDVINSPLSEYAVLGFEYGYSVARRDALVVWEAQFGDFANGAQIIIDQFIASGQAKWQQTSGLVMLLPHGLEGQGPEHSSARIERYLQLAADDNLCIINPSTPANYFHAIRRQALGGQGRPLIVVSPKTLLRLPAAVSPLADFMPDKFFQAVISHENPTKARKVIFCSGKIAYELEDYRRAKKCFDVAIVRIEQLYPLPAQELQAVLQQHTGAQLLWVQEEPENMGAWSWYDRRMELLAKRAKCRDPRLVYCGRPESPSPAGSFHSRHEEEQAEIVQRAFL